MAGDHLDPKVMEAVHRSLPHLRKRLEDLKGTWPKPGDQGMGSVAEAAAVVSERDAQKAEAKL